jgi:hypothetical protein
MRAAPSPAANQPKQQTSQPKIKRDFSYRRKVRIARIIMFLINTAATYFLIVQIQNPNPLTRTSVLIIAAMIGVMVICFIVPIILGVYEYIENNF